MQSQFSADPAVHQAAAEVHGSLGCLKVQPVGALQSADEGVRLCGICQTFRRYRQEIGLDSQSGIGTGEKLQVARAAAGLQIEGIEQHRCVRGIWLQDGDQGGGPPCCFGFPC